MLGISANENPVALIIEDENEAFNENKIFREQRAKG